MVIAAGLIYGGYRLGKKPTLPEAMRATLEFSVTPVLSLPPTPGLYPTPTTFPDETSQWKTYLSAKYSYQFKYPKEWSFKITLTNEGSTPLYVIRETVSGKTGEEYEVSIKTWDNPNSLSLEDWLQFMKDSKALPLPADDIDLVANDNVGGEPAFKIWSDPISKGKEPGKCFQACPILTYYFTHKNKAFSAQLIYLREIDEESREAFGSLLSTFKFL